MGALGDILKVHVRGERHRTSVNPENLQAAGGAGHANLNLAIESSGAPQRRVEDLGYVRRPEDNHLSPRHEAVHQPKQLRDDALFHLADHLRALGRHRVDLVDEDDRRSVPGRFFEHVPKLGLALPVELAHDLGAVEVDEMDTALGGDRPRKQGLAGPRRAVQQDALWREDAEPLEDARMLQRQLDDLADALQFALEAANVLVGDARRLHRPVVPLDDPDIGALVDHHRSGRERPNDLEIDGFRECRDADDAARDDRDAFQIFDDAFRRDGRLIDRAEIRQPHADGGPVFDARDRDRLLEPASTVAPDRAVDLHDVLFAGFQHGCARDRHHAAGDLEHVAWPRADAHQVGRRQTRRRAADVFHTRFGNAQGHARRKQRLPLVDGRIGDETAGVGWIGWRRRLFGHVADHDGRPESLALVSKRS